MPTNYNTSYIALVFVVVGILGIVAGLSIAKNSLVLRWRGRRVRGVVLDLRSDQIKHSARAAYSLVLGFTTLDGKEVQTQTSLATSEPRARRGEQVIVLYHPDDPTNADIQSPSTVGHRMLGVSILLVLGIVATIVGLLWLVQ